MLGYAAANFGAIAVGDARCNVHARGNIHRRSDRGSVGYADSGYTEPFSGTLAGWSARVRTLG